MISCSRWKVRVFVTWMTRKIGGSMSRIWIRNWRTSSEKGAAFMSVTLCRMKPADAVPAGRITASAEVIADFCRRHHIHKLSLFGSVLRDDFRPESDVDVLVEFKSGDVPDFFDLIGMKEELMELFGHKVDLKTPNSLSPSFRDRVLREALPLHDAA
jgi:predicted nucleotidyltransferase